MSHVAEHSTQSSRYAKCVEVSKRIRWDIDRDVIRGRTFDFSKKFLPDGLSKVDHEFFKQLIFGNAPVPTADSHHRLRKASTDLYAGLFSVLLRDRQMDASDKLTELKFFLECIFI